MKYKREKFKREIRKRGPTSIVWFEEKGERKKFENIYFFANEQINSRQLVIISFSRFFPSFLSLVHMNENMVNRLIEARKAYIQNYLNLL